MTYNFQNGVYDPKSYSLGSSSSLGLGLDGILGRETSKSTGSVLDPSRYSFDLGYDFGGSANTATPWYKNNDMLSSYAGLGSALVELATLPSAIEYANAQTDMLKHNLATAKEEQARRNKNISSFNSMDASKYV